MPVAAIYRLVSIRQVFFRCLQAGPALPLRQLGCRLEHRLQGAQKIVFSWFPCPEYFKKVLHYFVCIKIYYMDDFLANC